MDELNACLGLLVSNLPPHEEEMIREVRGIQSFLFHIGARVSGSAGSPRLQSLRQIREEDIEALERSIDRMEERLRPLKGFILPGGHPGAATAHVCRAVCRRAERRVAALLREGDEKGGPDTVLVYLNRLSDYLFVLARYVNQVMGVADSPWEKK